MVVSQADDHSTVSRQLVEPALRSPGGGRPGPFPPSPASRSSPGLSAASLRPPQPSSGTAQSGPGSKRRRAPCLPSVAPGQSQLDKFEEVRIQAELTGRNIDIVAVREDQSSKATTIVSPSWTRDMRSSQPVGFMVRPLATPEKIRPARMP